MDINDFVNLRMLSHPVNWLSVWIVLIFGGIAIMLISEAGKQATVS